MAFCMSCVGYFLRYKQEYANPPLTGGINIITSII